MGFPDKLRWIRIKNHKPDPRDPEWRDDDWLLVDGNEVLARTYAYEHGPQGGRWFWALSAWGGHSGTADSFEQARVAVKARLEALGLAPTQNAD